MGNPVRREIAGFDRERLRAEGLAHFQLIGGVPVLGAFGGSLGALAVNEAIRDFAASWTGEPLQIVHLTGESHLETYTSEASANSVTWRRLGFEDRMDLFFAATDLVLGRAGGGVAEVTATATPAILMPGEFGSTGHQRSNAGFLEEAGAAVVVDQSDVEALTRVVADRLFDQRALTAMREAAEHIAKPHAADDIADAMIEAAS